MQPVTLCVNGEIVELVVDPLRSLLQTLRDDLGLTGTKEGCGTGYCGACTVIVGAHAVNACLYLTVDADRKDIITIEGLADEDGTLHPVQQAFAEHTALQCGFCTPGMILSAAAFLAENPAPDESEIRNALAGNLCRCTGYQSIVRAVFDASKRLRDAGRTEARVGRQAPIRARA